MTLKSNLKNLKDELASVIRKRRSHLKLSQEDIAEKAEIDRTYVSRLENGKADISIAVAYKIALALKTTLTQLIKDAERKL